MALVSDGLDAQERGAASPGSLEQADDHLGRLLEVVRVRGEACVDVVPEVPVGIAGFADVEVLDPGGVERVAERRLREAAATRQRQRADVDDARDAMPAQ